jgi:hypothetical protein
VAHRQSVTAEVSCGSHSFHRYIDINYNIPITLSSSLFLLSSSTKINFIDRLIVSHLVKIINSEN